MRGLRVSPVVAAAGVVLVAALIVGVAAVLSRDDDSNVAEVPSPTIEATAPPRPSATAGPTQLLPPVSGFVGPVVIYRKEEYPTVTFVAYDLGAGRQLWSVPLVGDDAFGWASVGGRRLAVSTRSAVWIYTFDGSAMQEVMRTTNENESYEWVAVSPDGKTLAVVLHHVEPPGTPLPPGVPGPPARWEDNLIFYDLDANRELRRVESTIPEFEGFDSFFGPLMWLWDSSGVFMWGQTNSDRPGSYATVFVDGRVLRHDLEGAAYVAPNAQVAVEGISSLGCQFYSGHSVVVQDLQSGRDLVSIQNEARAFTGVDWSPDSREFLFESRPWRDDFDCVDRWWAAEPLLFLIRLDSGVAEPAEGVESVYRRWYGDSLTWLDCGGQFVPPRPHPFGNAIALACRDGQQEGTLYVHGQAVDTGRTFRLIGFVR